MQLLSRQWLDMMVPSNWPWSNPRVIKTTIETQGANLLRGPTHAYDDWRQSQGMAPLKPEEHLYRPGIEVAGTPGEVVYRNHLVELIQYTPTTRKVALLEDIMAERGFLTGHQMAGSFQFLRARDLVWSARMREYLLGEPDVPNDLMAWNADVTRMPAVMHTNYLHSLYLHNELAEGRYEVLGEPVSLGDLQLPIFAVGTLKDHVTPWRSAYKEKRLVHADMTFVLTSGGHNAGVVSEPDHAGRDHQLLLTKATDRRLSPEAWKQQAPHFKGSWWPAWHEWLVANGSGMAPARLVSPLDSVAPAPGEYVMTRYRD